MVLLLVALVALLALVTACVESSEEDARTPSNATTIINTAPQTNSDGETVPAPGASAPSEEPAPGGEGEGGDAAEGEQVFATSCSSCHLNNGQDAGGIGPQIAGAGLDEPTARDIIENGVPGTAMAGGLVTGDDYENVVAYVLSLQ